MKLTFSQAANQRVLQLNKKWPSYYPVVTPVRIKSFNNKMRLEYLDENRTLTDTST